MGVIYCEACGEENSNQNDKCINCSAVLKKASRIGWSNKVNDPLFTKYNKNETKWKLIFGLTLTVVAFFGFNIFGPKNGMKESEALLVGSVIGGMFFLITIGSILRKKAKKPWSGVVINKTHQTKIRKYNDSEGVSRKRSYEEYRVIAKDDRTGKNKIISTEENATFKYDYFKVGDKIKYHAIGNNGLEKYDKSKDEISFCLACNYLNDIKNDKCEMCGCPIIK